MEQFINAFVQILTLSHSNLVFAECTLKPGSIYWVVETLTSSLLLFFRVVSTARVVTVALEIWRWRRHRAQSHCGSAVCLAIWTSLHTIFWMILAALTLRATFIHGILVWKAKVRKTSQEPDTPVRHQPQKMQKYRNSKFCYEQKSVEQKTNVFCDSCAANLCFTSLRNCCP